MEERTNKGNNVLLLVIGAATLLVAVVGATFAYFSATVTGNMEEGSNVDVTTTTISNITITYKDGDTVSLMDQNLPKVDADTPTSDSVSFSLAGNMGTATLPFHIKLEGVTNTFCQKVADQNATACDNAAGLVDVADEVWYKVDKCTDDTYTTCDTPITTKTAYPTADGNISTEISKTGNTTEYYKVTVGYTNKAAEQNYNQGKALSGRVVVRSGEIR